MPSTEVEFQPEALWHRFQGFLSQVCTEGYTFVLASSLEVEGVEFRQSREIQSGPHGLDSTIGACLFSLATYIHAKFPEGGHLLFAAPSEWAWCPQQQFVEEPVRFFFETNGGDWYLNMATRVAVETEGERWRR